MKNATLILYGATSFLGSALLFSVEPMIGKMALPLFGGTPAVWNTCLVYFQVLLLVGYLLSGNITPSRGNGPRVVSGFYLIALALLLVLATAGLPIRLSPGTSGFAAIRGRPALDLLAVLWISSALPLILVSATAPLVQRWFAETGHPRADDPYFLYVASNAGSLIALLSYPIAIEPNLSLADQTRIWSAGFVLLGVLLLAGGLVARRTEP